MATDNPYGSVQLDPADALRAVGLRDQIHPDDVRAWSHPNAEAFEYAAGKDRDEFGHVVHGPFTVGDGIVSITDLRQQLAAGGVKAVDPALPDDHRSAGYRLADWERDLIVEQERQAERHARDMAAEDGDWDRCECEPTE